MYMDLGQNTMVLESSVVGIFDLDNSSYSKLTRDYLSKAEKRGRVVSICDDLPKSFVVCDEKGAVKVYISQLSSATLLKRSAKGMF